MASDPHNNEKRQPHQSEYRVLLPDGKERWLEALGNTTYDDAGQPKRMTGICVDITARKLAEEALRESEERFARS